MTVLRFPQDVDLHDERTGEHIEIQRGDSPALKARMKRHLARHARGTAQVEEMAAMAAEWASADKMVANVEETRWEIRSSIMARAKELHETKGVTIVELSRMFDLDERTIRDYFKHGRPQNRRRRGQ